MVQSIVIQTERRSSPTRRAVTNNVTLATGTMYEFFSHQVYSTFMYLLFMIPLMLGVMPNLVAKMTGKTFLESEYAQAAYKMGVLTFIFWQLPQRSLRHLRNKLSLPNPLLTSRCGAVSYSARIRTALQKSS